MEAQAPSGEVLRLLEGVTSWAAGAWACGVRPAKPLRDDE